MNFDNMTRTMGALALGASLLVSSGCAETALVGQADDSQLQNLSDYQLVALGMEREINDVVYSGYNVDLAGARGLSDDVIAGAAGGTEERYAIGDLRTRPDNGTFGQIHEAIWTAYKIIDIGLGLIDEEDIYANRIVARALLNAGYGERMMADYFCEATFGYSPLGGYGLPALDEISPVGEGALATNRRADPVSKIEMYQRAVYSFEKALETAQTVVANGDEDIIENDVDPEYFNPDSIIPAAYAGLAQAHHALALLGDEPAANWAAALDAAAMVPTDFIHLFNTDEIISTNVGRYNRNWLEMWTDNEVSVWEGEVNGRQWGAAISHVAHPDDPRVEVVECHDFDTYVGPDSLVFNEDNINITMDLDGDGSLSDDDQNPASWLWPAGTAECDYFYENGWQPLERSSVPRWLDWRWNRVDGIPGTRLTGSEYNNTQVPGARGTWMRLIEAEAALRLDSDIGTFTQKVNEVRAERGAPPITAPATIGQMEYPNELDDAMSLLDAEVLLDHYGELRRFSFLHNWNHPFITGNHATIPEYQKLLDEVGGGFQRMSCSPIPQDECNLNAELNCEVLTSN